LPKGSAWGKPFEEIHREMLKKWMFWWKAKNRHGIHSPFIYNFLDQGLYRRDLRSFSPARRLLLAAVDHFQPEQVGSFPEDNPTAQWLREVRKGLRWGAAPFDLMVFESPGNALKHELAKEEDHHNDTVVYVGNLRKDRESLACWEEVLRSGKCRVALETYDAGLLFFRQQQAAQHFRIRI
jgi:hypothetical protein